MTDEERQAAIEHFEERAAIVEFDAGVPRANAESLALREVAQAYGKESARAVQEHRKEASNV